MIIDGCYIKVAECHSACSGSNLREDKHIENI